MNLEKQWRPAVMTAVVASAAVYVPAALAQTQPTNAQLMQMVRQQSAQIQRLNQRLNAMEQQKQARQPSKTGTPPAPISSVQPGANNVTVQKEIRKLQKNRIRIDWANGAPDLVSPSGQFTFGVGGRIQFDASGTTGSKYDSRNIAGTEFRRLRLDVHGHLTKPVLYKLELDFAGSKVGLKDVYIATTKKFQLGQGAVFLGKKFADLGLSARTSSKWTWFPERSTVANAISFSSGSYNTGLEGEFYGKQHWHVSAAVGTGKVGGSSSSNDESDNVNVFLRAHWDPIDTGNTIVGIGAFGIYEYLNNNSATATLNPSTQIPGHFNQNVYVEQGVNGKTGSAIDPDHSFAYGGSLAALSGRFAADIEYGRRNVHGHNGSPNLVYDAYAGQIGFSLTGEQFGYSTKLGVWTHPDIAHPVTSGGWGAWEAMARYEAINFDNSNHYDGGKGHGITAGLQWYLNDYLRISLADTYWHTHNHNHVPIPHTTNDTYFGEDDGNTINARAQVVF